MEKILKATIALAAMLALAAPAFAVTPTPDVSGSAERQRQLNAHSAPGGVKLGDLLRALWGPDVKSGGAVAINTPDATPGPGATTVLTTAGVLTIKGKQFALSACSSISLTGADTTSGQYRKVSICSDGATCRAEIGAVAASQATAVMPACADSEALLGYISLPVSFTGGTTGVTSGMVSLPPGNPTGQVRY